MPTRGGPGVNAGPACGSLVIDVPPCSGGVGSGACGASAIGCGGADGGTSRRGSSTTEGTAAGGSSIAGSTEAPAFSIVAVLGAGFRRELAARVRGFFAGVAGVEGASAAPSAAAPDERDRPRPPRVPRRRGFFALPPLSPPASGAGNGVLD
ncbi:MAG TPA: hypothetical protein VM008_06270 [Phycisphaerae bacterium]|nr:hypothetical protein [Phycisphaerae bacterium]